MDLKIETHPWHHQRHHAEGGYRNIWQNASTVPSASSGKALGWVARHLLSKKVHRLPPMRPVSGEALRERPARLRVTWLGHAATFIQTPTLDLLTDPMLGDRASPLSFIGPKRLSPLPLALGALPNVDLILVSHNHYDHLDEGSIRALVKRFDPAFIAPLGVASLLRSWGAGRVTELDWWQVAEGAGLRCHCTPARHFSGRGLRDRDQALWASFFLEIDDLKLYFGADSGYAGHFTEIRERLGAPEVALLPIGAFLPRWMMAPVHVSPEEAVQAFFDLEARHFLPIHWGTFDMAEDRAHEAADHLRRLAAEHDLADRVHLLDIGGQYTLEATASGVERSAPSVEAN